jgi:hypothetical protein
MAGSGSTTKLRVLVVVPPLPFTVRVYAVTELEAVMLTAPPEEMEIPPGSIFPVPLAKVAFKATVWPT